MRRRTTVTLITLSLIIGLVALSQVHGVKAKGGRIFKVPTALDLSKTPAAREAERVPHGLKLQKGRQLRPRLDGESSFSFRLNADQFKALTLATYDFDADGAPDLISGYGTKSGGALVFYRGNPEAFSPARPEALRDLARGQLPDSFLQNEARAFELPEAPDFLAAGDFDRDGDYDLIAASRGGRALYLLAGNGKGDFATAHPIALPGKVTAMTVGEFDLLDERADVAVGVTSDDGSSLLVFSQGVARAPLTFSLPAEAAAIASGQLDRDPAMDLAVAAGGRVWILRGQVERHAAEATLEHLDEIAVPGYAIEIALGDFLRDRDHRTEMAVLSEDGSVQILSRGQLDTRPVTDEELRMRIRTLGRGRADESLREQNLGILDRAARAARIAVGMKDDLWKVEENLTVAVAGFVHDSSARIGGARTRLVAARLSGEQADDLMVMDGSKLSLLAARGSQPKSGSRSEATSSAGDSRVSSTLDEGEVVAAIPMRLNVLAQPGLVLLKAGNFPVAIPAAPAATFTVTKTADTNDGVCNADCSLREAIRAANASPGADLIMVPAGTYMLTIAGNNENAATTGDLDITDGVTIAGAGAATTIIQAGPSVGAGIDKVFSINPTFTSAFATSLSGLTIRFGKNTSGFNGDGLGGALDWDGSGTGTLAISGCLITGSTTADGDGGGLALTNGTGNTVTTVTITNSTISDNQPARAGANSPEGGGIFAGVGTSINLTNSTITNNNNIGSGGQGEGGGYFSFQQTTETLELHGCAITNNQAPSHGGGVRSAQRTTIDQNTTISGNISGGQGGGVHLNQNNPAASLITKTTFTNNSAATSGGGIRHGSGIGNNNLNVSFCRFAGNTALVGSGLAVFNGNATAENNWWGCNTGPGAAPCNTAQIETGGTGALDFNPWIVLSLSANPASLDLPEIATSTLTASFLQNSSGGALSAGNLDALVGLPIAFNNPAPVLGNISVAQASIQVTGTATATYTATAGGTENLEAVVDSGVAALGLVIQAPPTIIAAGPLTRQQGVAASNSQIATVADPAQPANTLVVTVNDSGSATAGGVTIDTITINASGQVFANVAASCAASGASFTLSVTNNRNRTATAQLMVNVTANTPPTLGTYPQASVARAGSTTISPTAPPADDVSVASLTASAPGFNGTFSGDTATGVITISNAGPAGTFTVTVTAIDNCGAAATTTFFLTVNAPNNPPTITGATTSRQQGSPASTSQIATISDVDQAAKTLVVTVNGSSTATAGGVTVSDISVDAAGAAMARVVASCTASSASFTLTVTDNMAASATATLVVNVTTNAPPTLGAYPATSVVAGASTTVTPSVAPSDNGAIVSLTVSAIAGLTTSTTDFIGTLSINRAGVVTIANAGLLGTFIATVTATDNCGAQSSRSFTLTVAGNDCLVTINPATLGQAHVAVSYAQPLSATPAGNYTFSLSAGSLPPGLRLATLFSGPTIAGIPTGPGTYSFTIKAAKNGTTCRGTRSYTVTIPTTVAPILECVRRNGNGTFTAHFGYDNSTGAPVLIPIGQGNFFTPGNQNRGQITVFQPGRVANAFSVVFNGRMHNLAVWFLRGPDGVARPANVLATSIGRP